MPVPPTFPPRTLPNGFYQGGVANALIAGDQGQALGTRRGGDQAGTLLAVDTFIEPVKAAIFQSGGNYYTPEWITVNLWSI